MRYHELISLQEAADEATMPTPNPDEDLLLYHGTSTPLTAVRAGLLYLTPDEEEADGYAHNGHRYLQKAPNPHVHTFAARPGKILDINSEVVAALENDDVDETIATLAERARRQGYRYLTFEHPSFFFDSQYTVYVSLYPDRDLIMMD